MTKERGGGGERGGVRMRERGEDRERVGERGRGEREGGEGGRDRETETERDRDRHRGGERREGGREREEGREREFETPTLRQLLQQGGLSAIQGHAVDLTAGVDHHLTVVDGTVGRVVGQGHRVGRAGQRDAREAVRAQVHAHQQARERVREDQEVVDGVVCRGWQRKRPELLFFVDEMRSR